MEKAGDPISVLDKVVFFLPRRRLHDFHEISFHALNQEARLITYNAVLGNIMHYDAFMMLT